MIFERRTDQTENPLSHLVPDQTFAIIPEFTFESGATIRQVPVAYKSWGSLNTEGDNCMLICHPLTRSVDVEDWWANLMGTCPLEGRGKSIDESKFFIICLNVMGSPYGSASPLTMNPETRTRYGPEFPLATIRDDCRLHKMVLDDLGVKSALYGPEYIKLIVPISAPAKSSAWSMSWTESQRQSIFTDPKYKDGYYALDAPPLQGMTAARMTAMLTYRTRVSYERRFGRAIMDYPENSETAGILAKSQAASADVHRRVHNEGHRHLNTETSFSTGLQTPSGGGSPAMDGIDNEIEDKAPYTPPMYSAHSYLRYQADKFNERFDANCYIHLSRKMDFHDISFRRGTYEEVVKSIRQPALVCGMC
ncbi:homoserine O- acetyltransferase [Gryganskiella cystojenkinii]|nr:homoserine O- acetyltransferase [Gryganskiella cystojenkinii]